jgi:peptidyl-prolyl cis-trans isomerase B (cyclophilin B)
MMKVALNTNYGRIVLDLDEVKAPKTLLILQSTLKVVITHGTIFHRVIAGFMIQGGGFDKNMSQKATKATIQNEADNGLKNDVGTIAMARTSDPHSASAQFFINVKNNSFLNHTSKTSQGWGYAVFGKVSEGMDIVSKIEGVRTSNKGGHGDVPVEPVIIESAEVLAG